MTKVFIQDKKEEEKEEQGKDAFHKFLISLALKTVIIFTVRAKIFFLPQDYVNFPALTTTIGT